MAGRLGIEVSRSACRIVELDRTGAGGSTTIVRSYSQSNAADAASLAPFRGRNASVVIWGLHGEYRQAAVTSTSYRQMRRQAVSAIRQAGLDTQQMLADIATVGERGAPRRAVVVALARTNNVAAALRTFTAAGVKVRSLVTPALALMSLARMRRRFDPAAGADTVEAYVALEETTTAVALMRDGALLAARELDWGYQSAAGVRSRDDAARRLGDAIEGFLADCDVQPKRVSQICVCGGMPELRNMTLPLMERLDVEVEPLDSLFGIDAARLPEPADDFRERVVEMRLAWAVAADRHAPIDFLRERKRRIAKTALTRAAVVAGIATGVGLAWRLQRLELFQTASPPPKATAIPSARSTPIATPPALTPREEPPRAVASAEPAIAPPAVPIRPPTTARNEPSAPPPLRLSPVPEPTPAALTRDRVTPPPRPPAPRASVDQPSTPFDGSLGTILYGSDRKLAIVDGRIVQVGDDVRGARVVDILPDAVLFRDVQGRLRKLSLQDSRR